MERLKAKLLYFKSDHLSESKSLNFLKAKRLAHVF